MAFVQGAPDAIFRNRQLRWDQEGVGMKWAGTIRIRRHPDLPRPDVYRTVFQSGAIPFPVRDVVGDVDLIEVFQLGLRMSPAEAARALTRAYADEGLTLENVRLTKRQMEVVRLWPSKD